MIRPPLTHEHGLLRGGVSLAAQVPLRDPEDVLLIRKRVLAERALWVRPEKSLPYAYVLGACYHPYEQERMEAFAGVIDTGNDYMLAHFPEMAIWHMRAWEELLGMRVILRGGFPLPGTFQIAHSRKVGGMGDIHVDTLGLEDEDEDAYSMVLPICNGDGGLLRLWDCMAPARRSESTAFKDYQHEVGSVTVFNSFRYHQIQPVAGLRIMSTSHARFHGNRWQVWA